MTEKPSRALTVNMRFVAASLLILVASVSLGSVQPVLRWTGEILLVLGLVLVLVVPRPMSFLPYPLTVWLLAWAFLLWALLPLSPLPVPAVDLVSLMTAGWLMYFVVGASLHRGFAKQTWWSALIAVGLGLAAVEVLLGILWAVRWYQVTQDLPASIPYAYRATGVVLGHPNALSGYLNLLLVPMTFRYLHASGLRRAGWAASLGLVLVAQWLTSSRTGWVAGFMGLAAFLGLTYLESLRSLPHRPGITGRLTLSPRLWRRVGAGILLLGLAASVFLYQASAAPGHAAGLPGRMEIWSIAASAFHRSPWVGNGPGSFAPLFASAAGVPPGFVTSHAHNAVLQVLAENGLIGLVLLGGTLGAILVAFRTQYKEADGSGRRDLAVYVGVAVAIGAHHLLDFLLESTPYLLGVMVILGLAFPLGRLAPPVGRRWTWIAPVVMALFSVAGLVWSSRGAGLFWNGNLQARAGSYAAAASLLCAAQQAQPAHTFYAFQCALATAWSEADGAEPKTTAQIAGDLRETLDKDPYWAIHWGNAAALLSAGGDSLQAAEAFDSALSRAPRLAVLWMNRGAVEESQGEFAAARQDYSEALRLDPWLSRRAFFQETPLRAESAKAFDYPAVMTPVDWKIWLAWEALEVDDLPQARTLLAQSLADLPPRARLYAALALEAQRSGRTEEASRWIEAAAFLDPYSIDVHAAAARIHAANGDLAAAEQEVRRVFQLDQGLSYSGMYYGRAYLRYSLPFEFVPSFRLPGSPVDFLKDPNLAELIASVEGAP